MISNQVLQSTIEGIKEISRVELGIMDADGREVAVTADVFKEAAPAIPDFAASAADSQSAGPYQFFKVFDDKQLEYVIVVCGETDNTLMIGRMAAFQVQGLVGAFKEHYDKDSFMKNLLLDNLLLIDIYERAKKLHIKANMPRVVLLVEADRTRSRDKDVLTTMQEYIGTSAGTVVGELKELSHSYKEAKMALDVSKIFFDDKKIIAYNQLGIGRLIYQLPIPLCRMFIREVFKDKRPDEFDEETLTTINKFFENNLNVSETSRQLFIHRNTLVYRLDKLQKSTGLDLRVFDDAITFKIALMVVKYMNYMERENQ